MVYCCSPLCCQLYTTYRRAFRRINTRGHLTWRGQFHCPELCGEYNRVRTVRGNGMR